MINSNNENPLLCHARNDDDPSRDGTWDNDLLLLMLLAIIKILLLFISNIYYLHMIVIIIVRMKIKHTI